MRRRFGSEINWFRAVGGLTVCITLDVRTFKNNLAEIMKNTCHSECMENIVLQFVDCNAKVIDWQIFMAVVKKCTSRWMRCETNRLDTDARQSMMKETSKEAFVAKEIVEAMRLQLTAYSTGVDRRKSMTHYKFSEYKAHTVGPELSDAEISFKRTNCYS